MSILGRIFSRILPHHAEAEQASAAAPAQTAQAAPAAASAAPTAAQSQPQAPQPAAAQPTSQPTAATATMERVDVAQVLDGLAAKNPQKLDWRHSIVDMMKLVGMDSTLQERKDLADELGYTGDKNDSARMNIWLHQEVMKKLEENGGKVPDSLKQ